MPRRKLSAGRSRTDLIAGYDYGVAASNGVPDTVYPGPISDQGGWPLADAPVRPQQLHTTSPAAAAAMPAPPADGDGGYQPEPYDEQPDETVICPSCEKHNAADAVFCDQCGFKLAGAEGVVDDSAPEAPAEPTDAAAAVTVPPAPAKDAPPVADPKTAKGIDNGVVCADPDCGHLASEHVNTTDGDNTGACATPGCACQAMTVDADGDTPDDDSDGGSEMAATVNLAGPIPDDPAAPAPAADPAAPPAELNAPPAVEGGQSMGPAFTIPVAIIEGQPTGDGREIAAGALDWRVPPLPLMGLATETHDPEGWDQNDPAVICGRIDSFERQPGEGDTQIIVAKGAYLPNDDGMYFASLNEAMGRLGISADVAVQATEVTVGDVDPDGWPIDMSEILTQGTIMGLTVCPYPAFEGAYIVLGDGTDTPAAQAIPQTDADTPVPDAPPAAVVAGGQLVRLITYEECVPCDLGIEVVVASGAGPNRPPAAWFTNPDFTPEDGRLVEILDRRGNRVIGGKYACPLTVTADGRVYGHIAPWDVCHTGMGGQCVLAPHSAVDYAHFKRGQHIITAEGDKVRVGVLTADTGHASTRGITASEAMAHYDNTALAAADVNIGEDDYGIWVAGAIRPDATDEQIRKLTAASISGDWRNIGGRLELVAALAVNNPGFPLAVVAGDQVETLVAAGGKTMQALKAPAAEPLDPVIAALLPLAGKHARERISAGRARTRIAQPR